MSTAIAAWRMPDKSIVGKAVEKILINPTPNSLDDATNQLPGGAYTTFRTFGRYQVLSLTEHLNRLEETSRLAGAPVIINRPVIKQALHQAFSDYPYDEKRVRIILDLFKIPGTFYILIEELMVPDREDYEHGVKVITHFMQRENPQAKLTGFIKTAASVREELPEGIHEVVMIGKDHRALEGLSSNFFGVKNGEIWTAGQDVLSGITRQMILKIIAHQRIPLVLQGIRIEEMGELDEAFLTSTSRSVLPIREIDGKLVGDGKPGKITQQLMRAYQTQLEKSIKFV